MTVRLGRASSVCEKPVCPVCPTVCPVFHAHVFHAQISPEGTSCRDIVWRTTYHQRLRTLREITAMPTPAPRSEKLDLRLTPAAQRTLQAAAVVARRSVSEFV
jgi:hypothetical protein